ncbi:C80 family cysteine peptidase [Arsenophonus sp. aPb]|uniref:C80 family cysteine peptidase n=1 Tax=Arsenophonus sp. aPb TaxID=3041619 RepID=UPI0024688677|nr:C80 family cysteine peptidase [Arsenophonus sp. aPb]WGL97291.1 C80 family cysteine peptidase [Arsenophonus sp. aPb]
MMAIVIEKNSKTGKLIYAFFDPNNGVIEIENKDIFIEFLNYIVKTRQDAYNFIQLRDGNVDVFISEMEYDEQITEQAILPKLDENLVNITTNKILCENEYTFILDLKTKIIFKKFNDNTRTTFIELISEKHKPKRINILMDSLSVDEILMFFTSQHKNILALSDNNLHIRITNGNYQIRKIINGSDIIYRLPNSRELLEFYLSEPIATLSHEQLPVELFELHNNEILGDIAPRKLDNWWDPRVNPELIPQQNKMELVKPQLAQANNVYNVIIQLEGEDIINKAAANLIGKHPNNTILIQYDLENDQYRLVYGDIDKVITNNSRWLLIGHGRFDEQKKQRVFANQSAYTIVDKLKKLKTSLLANNEPDKIVLLGCKLGQGNLLDNFALNISQEFWHKDFKSTIVAYTKDLAIHYNGRKEVYLDESTDSRQPAKYYKNQYQKDNNSGEIIINGEALILYLLRQIHAGDVSLSSITNRYGNYLSQYFHYFDGKLNLDLLKIIAYDNQAYKIFTDYFSNYNRINNNYDIGLLIDKLNSENISNVPLWPKVNAENIKSQSAEIVNKNSSQIIFRFSGDKKFRLQAELIAKYNPENTFIFQIDKDSNKAILEYGDLKKLNNTEIKKWLLLGNIVTYEEQSLLEGMTSAKLVDTLSEVKLYFGLNIPAEVCFFSQQGLGQLANPYDPTGIASETAINLAKRAINSTVSTYQQENVQLPWFSSQYINEHYVLAADHKKLYRFNYNNEIKQLYLNNIPIEQSLLMDIVTDKIDLNNQSYKYAYHLHSYLVEENDLLDIKKIDQIKFDPIINKKINNYFEQNKYIGTQKLIEWRKFFLNNDLPTIQQQAYDAKIVLENIAYRPEIINYLSPYSKYLLSQLFSYPNGIIDMKELMILIHNHQSLENLKISLIELAGIDERSEISQLSLQHALKKSQQWHNYYLSNIISLANRIDKKSLPMFNIAINPMPHSFYYQMNSQLGRNLALLYAYNENDIEKLTQLLQYHHSLLEFSRKRALTYEEQQFLANVNSVFNRINYLFTQKKIVNEKNINQLVKLSIGKYQLDINNNIFTILVQDKNDDFYSCKIYDPKMGEIRLDFIQKDSVYKDILYFMKTYLDDEIIIDNKKYHRYEMLGIKKEQHNNYRIKLYEIKHDDILYANLARLIVQLPLNQQESQVSVKIDDIVIPLAILQQAGAYIDQKKISLFSIRNVTDWQKKIRFDVVALNDYLSFYQGSQNNINLIKILKAKINATNNYTDLFINSDNLNDLAVIMQRFAYIEQYNSQQFADKNLQLSLQKGISHLPRYALLVNKLANTMPLFSLIQLVTATQSVTMQLNSDNLSDDERQVLENNLIVAWAANITNFSVQALQPVLLKAAYKVSGSFSNASMFANRVNAGLTIAATGFDLYYAYENFSQLENEQDPAIRQDLLVNGILSLINAGVSASAALAIMAGSSTAGPLGVLIGTGLMLGGMFYNAYRLIERVEEKIALTSHEKFQLAIGSILGLRPIYSIQNKLLQQQTASQLKLYRQQNEENFFKQVLQPAGYNLSIIRQEEENIAELLLYHLFDNHNNRYLTEQKYNHYQYDLQYLKHDLNIVSLPLNLWKQQHLDEVLETIKRKFTKQEIEKIIAQHPNRYQIELAKIKTYIPVSYQPSDEIILFSNKYNHVIRLLANQPYFNQNLASVKAVNAIYSIPNNNQIQYFNESLQKFLSKKNLINFITGISYNLANGDDAIVGSQVVKNQFICGNGKKIFIGGELDDLFILLFDKITVNENKYFDGNRGNDTLSVELLPYYQSVTDDNPTQPVNNLTKVVGAYINLPQGELKYLSENYIDDFANVPALIRKNYATEVLVDFINIENVMGSKHSQDLILGNEKDNILNGRGGVDIIYGQAGKDTLILNNGYANGGEGADTYIIERYNWLNYQEELPWNEQSYYWDPDNEKWQNLDSNKIGLKLGYDFNANIVIDEIEKENRSVVAFNYKLDEIIEVKLVDTDIYLQILSDKELINGEVKQSIIDVRLKNAYISLGNDEFILNHEYLLQTMDGFLLTLCLPPKLTKQNTPEKIFETIYFDKLDKFNTDNNINKIEINLTQNGIKNHHKNYLLPATLKPIIAINNYQHAIFHGDKYNNHFTSIKKNNYIYFSHGIDIYLLDDLASTDKINDSIIFDFKEINDSFTNGDIFIIAVKEYSGYDFIFEGNCLSYQASSQLAQIKFVNNLGDFYGKIYLLDKNNQYFFINYQDNKYQITPCATVQTPSEFDDNIFYPKGYSQIIKVNLSAGNDILTDMSETGKIIIAGDGNDIITAKSGDNMVVDGDGNDIISTGDGNDIIISTQGNNIIDAGKGNNVLAINHGTGDINVFLNEGNNKIFIQGLGGSAVFNYPDNNLVISSLNNNNKITIYDYEKYKDLLEINTTSNSDILFDEKDIALLIEMASSFQQKNNQSQPFSLTVHERDFINQMFQYAKIN